MQVEWYQHVASVLEKPTAEDRQYRRIPFCCHDARELSPSSSLSEPMAVLNHAMLHYTLITYGQCTYVRLRLYASTNIHMRPPGQKKQKPNIARVAER